MCGGVATHSFVVFGINNLPTNIAEPAVMIDYSRGTRSQLKRDIELGKGSGTLGSLNTASIVVKFVSITNTPKGRTESSPHLIAVDHDGGSAVSTCERLHKGATATSS